jgi:hypothetical protein
MIGWLISHQWKESVRADSWYRNLFFKIISGIGVAYLLSSFLILGFFIDDIITIVAPDADPVFIFVKVLFYYFLLDLFVRIFFQRLPVFSIQPYLHLPVSKRNIFLFLLIKSLFSLFNFLPLLLIIPFSVKAIPSDSVYSAWVWFLGIISLILLNNYLSFYIKKRFSLEPMISLLFLISIGILLYVDYAGYVQFSDGFASAILYVSANPLFILIPVGFMIFVFNLCFELLKKKAYLENIADKKDERKTSSGVLSFAERFGRIGQLIQLELKLIWRNTRPKMYVYFCGYFFALCYFVLYKETSPENINLFAILFCLFATGIFIFQHGQLLFAWEGSFIDFIISKNIKIKEFINAKYLMFSITSFFSFIITLPLAFLSTKFIMVIFCFMLYNIGINIALIIFLATYNSTRIDISKSAFFNWEGASGIHFFLIIPTVGVPLIIYAVISAFYSSGAALIVIAILGLAGILMKNVIINLLVKQFNTRKYKMATGFKA